MKHNKELFDVEMINLYLSGSVVTYRGVPVYIEYPIDHDLVRASILDRPGVLFDIRLDDAGLDFYPLRLGMINGKSFFDKRRGVAYVYRNPLRQWKIGLSMNNCAFNKVGRREDIFLDKRTLFRSKLFRNTIEGKYPSAKTALEAVNRIGSGVEAIAFSRDFAVSRDNILFYKTLGKVGLLENPQKPKLMKEFKYLAEALEVALNG